MTKEQALVSDFHVANGQTDPTTPTRIPDERMILRAQLILEELLELMHDGFSMYFVCNGVSSLTIAEALDNQDLHWLRKIQTKPDLVLIADACADIHVVTYGTELECGIDGEPVFAEVMRANMSKLGEDGKPIVNEAGKYQKGPNYTPPDIAPILAAQGLEQPTEVAPPEPPNPFVSALPVSGDPEPDKNLPGGAEQRSTGIPEGTEPKPTTVWDNEPPSDPSAPPETYVDADPNDPGQRQHVSAADLGLKPGFTKTSKKGGSK